MRHTWVRDQQYLSADRSTCARCGLVRYSRRFKKSRYFRGSPEVRVFGADLETDCPNPQQP